MAKRRVLYIVGRNINEYRQDVSAQILQVKTEVLSNSAERSEITVLKDACIPVFTIHKSTAHTKVKKIDVSYFSIKQ